MSTIKRCKKTATGPDPASTPLWTATFLALRCGVSYSEVLWWRAREQRNYMLPGNATKYWQSHYGTYTSSMPLHRSCRSRPCTPSIYTHYPRATPATRKKWHCIAGSSVSYSHLQGMTSSNHFDLHFQFHWENLTTNSAPQRLLHPDQTFWNPSWFALPARRH